MQQVQLIFEHFQKFGVINPIKWEYGKSKVIFLGHFIQSAEISPSSVSSYSKFSISNNMRKLDCLTNVKITYLCLTMPKQAYIKLSLLYHTVKLSHIESRKGLCLVGDASSIGMHAVFSKRSMTMRNQFLSF